MFQGKVLTIHNATAFDRGTYRCKAENNVKPPGLIDVTLDVFYRPVLIPFRRAVGQAPGRNYEVRLSCRVSGEIYRINLFLHPFLTLNPNHLRNPEPVF